MFFRSNKSYHRRSGVYQRGFRLRGNSLVLLFFFFMVGLFLHYGGRTRPLVAFWNDLKGIVGIGPSSDRSEKETNPYKAPEPTEDVASDEASDESSASDEGGASDGSTPDEQASQSGNQRFDFEKKPDFILPAFSSSDEIVRHDGYILRYRDQYEQADWVAYPLLAFETTGDADRDYERFQPDPLVESGTAYPTDYTRSGYDRGHLAPAGDFKFSQRLTRESFYMSNISPQAPQFNRGIWKELEDQVRTWARRDRGVYVVTGPVLKPGLETIGKKVEVAVPEQFYKVILYCNKPDIRMIGFLMNNEPSNEPLQSFVVPVDQIERLTGIDFFPFIPDDLERRLESSRKPDEWFRY
ncbi:DNA/RNA non-specific endonuclease [Rudanella paleaurantiibacter]|uniref:Endonuclease n=1 Tax=Rudanella paleaurantiibacter TaxID=2614655 RepID=A0A7J5U4E0_9BACT|nr:DNA/RNA non-specific endonuclease [Rudanella paleaurantiibacter]KAB7732708.1 DNA/RNA non-specific endonuclease [Rudanella paleaurantiibacter]